MSKTETTEMHPVQTHGVNQRRSGSGKIASAVTLRAYEVYCELYRPQPAMIENGYRGGFGVGELIAFLYARSFPKSEWRQRFDEARKGMAL